MRSRSADLATPRTQIFEYQRFLERQRSKEISRFVQYGYPWSELSEPNRQSGEYDDLRKPGWLPTAIVVNIIGPGESRGELTLLEEHAVRVTDRAEGLAELSLPSFDSSGNYLPPLEVIDGQHRLAAFDDFSEAEEFDLPVVMFDGLARSWQAYLFYTVNVKPKRINASLAFDLYPLLRTQEWLNKFGGHSIYRETRAQELVEAMWFHPQSPWRGRINMIGTPTRQLSKGVPMVSQSAWARSLMATYVKSWEGRGVAVGGLFGSPVGSHQTVLPWSRPQQAALLIIVWSLLRDRVADVNSGWAKAVRDNDVQGLSPIDGDPAFIGSTSLLATDQGVRAILYVSNDLLFIMSDDFRLERWSPSFTDAESEDDLISLALADAVRWPFADFLGSLAVEAAQFDWRTSASRGLTQQERLSKSAFRGSSGYRLIRQQLLMHLEQSEVSAIRSASTDVRSRLGL